MDRLSTLTSQQYQRFETTELMRVISTLACSARMGGSPVEYYEARWGASPLKSVVMRALETTYEKAAAAPGSTSEPTWAGALVTAKVSGAFVGLVRQASVVAKLPVTPVPFNTRLPYQVAGASMKWVGQGAPKPATTLGVGSVTLARLKASGIIVVSRELVQLSVPGSEQALQTILVNELTTFTDAALLSADAAVAGVSPAGILNGVSVSADIAATIAAFFTARPQAIAPTWIAAPASLGALSALDPANVPRQFKGYPLVTSPGAGANLILVDAPALAVADDGVELDTSDQALVEMNDAPATPTAATVYTSLWQANLTGIKTERYLNWQVVPGAVQFTATLS